MLALSLVTLILADPATRLVSDELGVELDLPPGARVVERPSVSGNHFLVRDGTDEPRWSLRIESIEAPAQGANATLGTLVAQRRGDHPESITALDHAGPDPEGRESAHGWFLQTRPDTRTVALGWFVAPQALGRCLVCSAVARPDALRDVQPLVNKVFASISLRDDQEATASVIEMLDRGDVALADLDEARLRGLVGRTEVLRVHAPDTGREIAYGTLSVAAAPRGAIKHDGQASADVTDREDGLLVSVHLRFAVDPAKATYVDRLQRFWVSWDLNRESWTDMTTTRIGDERSMQLELGIREAPTLSQPRGMLQVVRQDDSVNSRDAWSFQVDRTWLPRGLTWFLHELMSSPPDQRVGWWTWDATSEVPRVTLRRDVAAGPGKVVTWQGFDGLPTVTTHDGGRLIRSTRPDRTVVEVSSQATVEDAWRRAGLTLR